MRARCTNAKIEHNRPKTEKNPTKKGNTNQPECYYEKAKREIMSQ